MFCFRCCTASMSESQEALDSPDALEVEIISQSPKKIEQSNKPYEELEKCNAFSTLKENRSLVGSEELLTPEVCSHLYTILNYCYCYLFLGM